MHHNNMAVFYFQGPGREPDVDYLAGAASARRREMTTWRRQMCSCLTPPRSDPPPSAQLLRFLHTCGRPGDLSTDRVSFCPDETVPVVEVSFGDSSGVKDCPRAGPEGSEAPRWVLEDGRKGESAAQRCCSGGSYRRLLSNVLVAVFVKGAKGGGPSSCPWGAPVLSVFFCPTSR